MSNAGLLAVFAGYFAILIGIAVVRARQMQPSASCQALFDKVVGSPRS